MQSLNHNFSVDGFRFIDNLHTTARQLYLCSEVIIIIGSKQVPIGILEQLISEWSLKEEKNNLGYKNSKGKVTEQGKPTTALHHYISLSKSLGLVSGLNNFYSNTRLAYLLIHFISKSENNRNNINDYEKYFYLFQLMNVDADGILIIMSLMNSGGKNQALLQRLFKNELNERLDAKKDVAPANIKETIREKYRIVNIVWKRPEKYAEHILTPRCTWLETLGLVKISKQGSSAVYSLTEKGDLFYANIPNVSAQSPIKDVSESWIYNNFFGLLYKMSKGDTTSTKQLFASLSEKKRKSILGESLICALSIIKTSSPSKISLFDSMLYICISLFIERDVVIEFSEIIDEISKGIYVQGKQFLLNEQGRINESYITTRISE